MAVSPGDGENLGHVLGELAGGVGEGRGDHQRVGHGVGDPDIPE